MIVPPEPPKSSMVWDVLVRLRVPPFMIKSQAEPHKAAPDATLIPPPEIVSAAPNVFTPVRVSTPLPDLVTLQPEPEMTPPKLVEALPLVVNVNDPVTGTFP